MAGRLKYGPRYGYPHMLVDEIEIWERYMEKFPEEFETVDYDFRVGKGAEISDEFGDNFKRMAKMLSQKRIDVIGWVGDHPTIIEVKTRVGLSALGQVLGYKSLFKKYFKNFPAPAVMIICEKISDDDIDVLMENLIPVVVV